MKNSCFDTFCKYSTRNITDRDKSHFLILESLNNQIIWNCTAVKHGHFCTTHFKCKDVYVGDLLLFIFKDNF